MQLNLKASQDAVNGIAVTNLPLIETRASEAAILGRHELRRYRQRNGLCSRNGSVTPSLREMRTSCDNGKVDGT